MIPVTADNSNVCAVVAGKGAFYFDKSQYENNPSYIFINRFITDEELASLISHCIAVVCPYIDATQSGVIMSAYALNKPVIATTVGALPEMVEDGRFGYLIPPKDVTATEKAIRRIIKPGVSQQMSEFIEKDFATGNHSWSEIAKGIHDIYREIILKREKKR
jgi:glycosyltransferase involved in cell wall biosynthesis